MGEERVIKDIEEKFISLHDAGVRRHPKSWFCANQKAVHAAMYALDVTTPRNKLAISLVVLRVLDAVGAP